MQRRSIGVQVRMEPAIAMKITEHFGKRLRQWLKERGLGLVDLAEALRISYSYVALLGKPRPYGRLLSSPLAIELAEFLRIDPDEVFSAMGQINPLLLEEVEAEVLERELLELHRRLRSHLTSSAEKQVPTEG